MTLPSTPFLVQVGRVVPAIGALRNYSLTHAGHDVLAGLTVATVAVPQAMAYAMIAGLPPEVGLYTAIVMTAVGALFDSSKQLINGPTNAISIAVLSAIGMIADPNQKLQAAILLAFLVGSIQIFIALLRLGDLTRYVSNSVVVGFTAGASVLLILDQIKNLLGLAPVGSAHDHFLYRVYGSIMHGGSVHVPTACVGLGAIAAMVLISLVKRKLNWKLFPELLVVVVGSALVSYWLDLNALGVKIVGFIPARLPTIHAPSFDPTLMRELSTGALAIALLGLLEAIAMAKAIAAETRQKLDLNQQCFSEGVANVTGSLFGCFPGSGSLTRSAINQQAGAVTQWSGVVSAIAVAAIMLVAAPYARFIPRSALAGILMVTALRMVKLDRLIHHARATRFDAVLVVVTALAAFVISVEFCVLIGVVLSFFLVVPRIGRMMLTEFVIGNDGLVHERFANDVSEYPEILIFGLEGEMFFGASTSLEEHLQYIESRVDPSIQVVILRLKRVRNPDAVALSILDHFIERMQQRHVHLIICGVRPDLAHVLDRTHILRRLHPENVFLEQPVRQTSTLMAVQFARKLIGRDAAAKALAEASTAT